MWEVHYQEFEAPWEPEGYIFLAWAFGEIMGIVQLQSLEAWHTKEPVIDWRMHLPLMDRRSEDLAQQASSNRDYVMDWAATAASLIGRGAFAGGLVGACRDKNGGGLLPVSKELWGINDFWRRFAQSALNFDAPYNVDAEPTHWIFLEQESFAWFADDLRIQYGQPPIWQRRDSLESTRQEWVGHVPSKDASLAEPLNAATSIKKNLVGVGGPGLVASRRMMKSWHQRLPPRCASRTFRHRPPPEA